MEAVNVLNEVLQFVGEAIIAYLPLAISAVIILVLPSLQLPGQENLILKRFSDSNCWHGLPERNTGAGRIHDITSWA